MIEIKDDDSEMKRVMGYIQSIKNLSVIVGPNAGQEDTTIQKYAAANEFGAKIEIINNSLAKSGVHGTNIIVIPERSFMRSTFDKKSVIDKVMNRFERFFERMLEGKTSPVDVMGGVGDVVVSEIKATITSHVPPANAPSTIKKKGAGKGTLYDTGSLLKSIIRKVI